LKQNNKYVGFSLRIVATFLDVFVYYSLLALIYSFYPDKYEFFLLYDAGDPALYLMIYGGLFVLVIFDQVFGPVIFGRTFSRWICGYKILNKSGQNPTLWQSTKRYFSIIIFELFFLGLITFISSMIRNDKAAIHDIIAGTNAMYPNKQQGLKKIRLSLAVFVVMLSMIYLFVNISYAAYKIFVEPQEKSASDNNIYPNILYKEKNGSTDFVSIYGVDLFSTNEVDSYSICNNSSNQNTKLVDLLINNEKFTIEIQKSKGSVPIIEKNLLFEAADNSIGYFERSVNILNYYPFHSKINLTAERVVSYSTPQFSVFSPIENFAYILGKISFVISFPGAGFVDKTNVEMYSIIGEDFYIYTNLVHNEKLAGLTINFFQDNEIVQIDIFSDKKSNSKQSYEIINMINSNLAPSLVKEDIVGQCRSD
jgi:uncharacterized RDD family membrane protein YckC